MRSLNSPELFRNMGFWNESTQQALLDTEVAIAGNGGTGNLFGMELARIGIQKFRIADPEVFDDVNSNRVMGARVDTIGRNKAEVLKEDILKINPDAEIITYTEGITPENIEEFLSNADIALNGTELTKPELGTMLARQARIRKIGREVMPLPVLDIEYIGYAGQGTVFDPASHMTFERFMGIKGGESVPLDEIAGQSVDPSRYLVYLPSYGDLKTLEAMRNGAPLPSNMIGAGVAAQIGLSEVLKLVRRRVGERGADPTFAPAVRWYDAYTNESGLTRHPRASYYRHLGNVVVSNLFQKNEPASYAPDRRTLRGDIS
ncbi:MAG TPA: ThiF family adenylyltransferase [Candidatus Angelobacter sp.]|nr:ThiF family adenylyltransferase [Candidatus Angelobacter sp.]